MIRRLALQLRRYFRQKRYATIQNLIDVEQAPSFVMDLGGGSASFFAAFFPEPEQVILLDINLKAVYQAKQKRTNLQTLVADAGRLPLADQSISVTICNSVIEHVAEPEPLAVEIDRVSQSYFLQTPNGEFPLETHSLIAIPFYNFIPFYWLRRLMCRIFGANFDYVSSVQYVSEHKLRHLFPKGTLAYEKVLGLKKSYYVYQRLNKIRHD